MWPYVVFTCRPPISSICALSSRKYLEGFFFFNFNFLVLTVLFILHTETCGQVKIRMIMWKSYATGHTQIIWVCFKQYTSDTFWFNQISAVFYLWAHRQKYPYPLQREVHVVCGGIWRKPLLKVALNNVISLKCYSRDQCYSEHVSCSDWRWFFFWYFTKLLWEKQRVLCMMSLFVAIFRNVTLAL